jgi:hypothetical protein
VQKDALLNAALQIQFVHDIGQSPNLPLPLMNVVPLVFINMAFLGNSLQDTGAHVAVSRLANSQGVASATSSELPRAGLKIDMTDIFSLQDALAASRLASPPSVTNPTSTELLRLGLDGVDMLDVFSASWLMNTSLFMQINTSYIDTVEEGCLAPFRQAYQAGAWVANTRDWLDFSVEHLSHYWRAANICKDRPTFNEFIRKLDGYISHVEVLDSSPLSDTIAILAFMPYQCNCYLGCSGEALTNKVLTATLKSLQRAGMGRVVVVSVAPAREYEPSGVSFGETEVIFVTVDAATTKTRSVENNLPLGAIAGLQQAVRNKDVKWLGENTERWRSVFLAEPDQILHVKQRSIHDLARIVESGFVLSPHRLQPVPHPGDIHILPHPIPESSSAFKVETLETDDAICLDAGRHSKVRKKSDTCATWWWQCGFEDGNHSRLDNYTMMRLRYGSRVTVLAASEHGRKCNLQK